MDELFGTPAHPLLVHIPVVLLPLSAVVTIVMAVKPRLRHRLSWVLFGSTLVTAAVTYWATQAGYRLRNALQPALGTKADRHLELGNQTATLATIFFVGAACMVVMDRWYLPRAAKRSESLSRRDARSAVVLASLVALVGVVAAVWAIRTGHEGARITWDGVNVGG
jgi:uncharacterized membrane protein